jgi:hypothetical protein
MHFHKADCETLETNLPPEADRSLVPVLWNAVLLASAGTLISMCSMEPEPSPWRQVMLAGRTVM